MAKLSNKQKEYSQDAKNAIESRCFQPDIYYLVTSSWIEKWEKYLEKKEKELPPFAFTNKKIHMLDKPEHHKDFYMVPKDLFEREFSKYFCWEIIAEYAPTSVKDLEFQSSYQSETVKLPRDSQNEIEDYIDNGYLHIRKQIPKSNMGKTDSFEPSSR